MDARGRHQLLAISMINTISSILGIIIYTSRISNETILILNLQGVNNGRLLQIVYQLTVKAIATSA